MILAKATSSQKIFIISVLDWSWQKLLQYVGPVAWDCVSNKIKTSPLSLFS